MFRSQESVSYKLKTLVFTEKYMIPVNAVTKQLDKDSVNAIHLKK